VGGGFEFLNPFSSNYRVVITGANRSGSGNTCTGAQVDIMGAAGFQWRTIGGNCSCMSYIAWTP
jgi:hypothetical protein